MKIWKKFIISALAAALLLCCTGCGSQSRAEKQIFAMDTVINLTAYGPNAEKGLTDAVGVINSMERLLDPEDENSEVYTINHALGESTVVKGQIVEMMQTALTISERTGGALTPAIYPLVKLWGFVDGKYNVPTEEEAEALIPMCKFKNITITGFSDASSSLVTIPSGMELSFAALAKGCAGNYAISALRSAGVESAVISLGGNVQTLGTKPDGGNWKIAVQDPNNTGAHLGILSVGETAVVTSGGYQRYFDGPDGIRYHHILDPSTAFPAESGLLSVTIVCEDGIMADALSTTLFILGEDRALSYWQTYGGFEAVLVTEDGRVVVTNGLYESFTPSLDSYTYEYAG